MITIPVSASTNYNVLIDHGLLNHTAEHILSVHSVCKVALISDTNVAPLYLAAVSRSLEAEGFSVTSFVIPAGEASKTPGTYLQILDFLAANHFTRSDLLIALGGGVVGDMTGFVAATYLRGIRYVQLPTSLLAMVDSSVGGKTAIDLPSGKNLVGAFYQPILVLCDISTLKTLPDTIFRDGCAEVIKYGVLYDESLFDHLEKLCLNFDMQTVIARCITLKRDVVASDEFDTGNRQMLNLGHTIGHAVESLSSFTVSHGQAVAIGMAIISRSAVAHGLFDLNSCSRICNVLESFNLPTTTNFPSKSLYGAALSDKKRVDSNVNLIIPNQIGKCSIYSLPICKLESFIEAGL